ncbi:CCR4-NOT transcription complex subunit 1-like isoform X5 [Telopea speciosissima]|uniref:CCR4-NOT transcription complex subunit 1-like isoform X5 n=1 Tax=Telopea speciosissima TaxID=54955 RepID=UPI001CC3E125|nr:CCR4-NOT transcription complex subunit 1-like isoform X5 [Telopea speciosissima]
MLPFSSTVSNQIRFLLQSLNDSNSDSVVRELWQFTEYGSEGSILLLQTCLDHINFHGGNMQNMPTKPDFLAAVFRYLLDKPNFSTVFCEALRNTSINEAFLGDFCNALHLSVSEKIGLGLALCDSENPDIRTCGQNFCMSQIEELCTNPTSFDSHGQIQNIVMFLRRSESLAKHMDSFMQMLSLLQLKDITTFISDPFLSDDLRGADSLRHLDLFYESNQNDFDAVLAEIEKEISMADVMKELGYGCTINASHCKDVLSLFLPLTEGTLSRVLSTMAQTHYGLEDCQNAYSIFCSALSGNSVPESPCLNSWNVDILVDSIKQLAPGTNWVSVMENLDHEGFYFPNEEAFSFFMSVYANACQDPFPLHAICGSVWKNAEGQLSFLRYAVSAPPEIFTFAHSARQLAYVDAVHGHKLPQGNASQAWLCLDLLEVLCHLAERGHAGSVRTILEYPLKNCPEVLLLGMAHINTAFNLLQYEVSSTVLPKIIGNAIKNGVFLHLWHVNPNLLVRGFTDVHFGDQESMTRILGSCLELKIVSAVLDITPFSFSIKLAALASRKEQINLEKWLNDNLSTHKDVFFEECLKFLREIPLDATHDPANPFQQSVGVLNAYSETSSTFFKVLQAHAAQIASDQLAEELKKLHLASMHATPRLQNGGAVESTSDGYADDIEAEANSYFHQMFSGQLSIDAMVQMLARFKESPDKREQSIFECMIANLFEEYKFFPKYPERQLKIAAVLFGSLIKHQLVTHLTLGIALRGVLDALRKSADSKMFIFGAKALEQFVDRLVEWPQYCNHILQISHLRGTHSELVAFIERALARISSGHTESNEVNSTSNDQPQGSAQATSETLEASDSSWQLMGSNFTQPGQQVSSPLQLQQRHQGFLDDRHKASVTSVSYMKPLPSPAGQPSLVSTHDAVGNQKSILSQPLQTVPSQNVGSGPAAVSSSPGFLRSSRGITSTSMLRQHSYNTGFGSALNIETLVQAAERRDTPIEAPASEIQDKILFIVNNISTANLEAKAKEFTEILKEQYYPWFAQYMVMKRASIEPNFHDLYLKFLEKVNSKDLNKEIVKATYENCKVLLRSELIKSSSEERSLLKNLGSWLGKFTIGRNQALRAREIDPKALIIEAYEKGLMIAVIPFTSKILEPCQYSLAYQPPNPWTMGILSLLTEIYALPNLKMNLKFDIEVLFKNLGVDMKDVKPTSLLKDRVREVEGNPDFSTKDIGASQPQMVAEVNSGMIAALNQVDLQPEVSPPSHPGGHSNVLSQYTAPLHLASGSLVEDEKMATLSLSDRLSTGQGLSQVSPSQSQFSVSQLSASIANIGAHVVINPKLSALGLQLHFQRIVPMAMDRAIKEIMSPIVQRSVTIAMQTTKELVLKDYAMESEENRIYHAAHLMVASLAGSLAHVTCKEPLRGSISSHLRNLLQALNIAGEILEQAVVLVTNDNLDLGCAVIEQHATEKGVIAEVPEIILRCISRDEAALAVAQKVFKSLYENASNNVHVGAHLAILVAIRDVCKLVVKELTSWVIYSDEERKFNKDIAVGLIRSELLNLAEYNVHMAKLIDAGRNKTATEFAISLLQALVVQEPGVSVSELHNLVDALAKLAMRPGSPETLQQLVDIARNPAANSAALSSLTTGKEDKTRQAREKKQSPGRSMAIREDYTNAESMAADPAGFREQVTVLFGEWCRICELPGANDAAYTHYISQLQQSGLLIGDDISDRFFRILTELSVAHCLSTEVTTPASLSLQPHHSQHMSFFAIDMCAKLIFLILKYCTVDQGSNRLFLLPKILSVTVRVIQKDAEEKKTSFNPRPYFRLFINWLYDLGSLDPVLDGANFQVLTAFANAFHALQPLKVPGFSFAWLELVSHRSYMPKLLTLNPQKGWPLVQRLLVDLFKFLEPYLRNAEMGEPVHFLYKGTLRVLLVLLHDFPEFLCDYHFSFCDVIPPSCIQMRNVILSAFPRNMRLPDPSTPNLKIDLLAEISQSPRILSEVDTALKAKQMKNDIDEYLKTRQQGSSFLAELKQRLLLPPSEAAQAGTRYNVPLINSLVLYVGMQAIQQLQTRTAPHAQPMAQGASMDIFLVGAAMDIFQTLIGELDTEGRYLFLNAVANQLRYPNNNTHYFSFVLLYLFAEANQEIIQEQITRVLLERLIVNRPHPWGLLITFIELIKNPRYNFWNRSFTRCAPEIEKLFESVSRSCGGPKPMDESMVSGGISDSTH